MALGLPVRACSAWEASPRSTVSAGGGGAVYKEMLDFGGGLGKIGVSLAAFTVVIILPPQQM